MKAILTLAAGALAVSGCATVTRGQNDTLAIQSNVPATARLSTGHAFETLCAIKTSDLRVAVSAPGYRTWTATVTNKVAGAGGRGHGRQRAGRRGDRGRRVDIATGAALDLYPNPLVVDLVPAAPVLSSQNGAPTS